MNKPEKQHLIDPEICIRCYTCESTCSVGAIEHDDNNVVVDAEKCNFCMECIPVCPTGSIDEWRVVTQSFSVAEQLGWEELPEQEAFSVTASEADTAIEALDESVAALLAEAHAGAGGKAKAPSSASKPTINLHKISTPAQATVQGNYCLTDEGGDVDVHHLILDLGSQPFPILEGQSFGVITPGVDQSGDAHLPRLYSVSSPRDGERANFNNLSITVKREEGGLCSNYLCDLKQGDRIELTGPFGSTFLLPDDDSARLLMICTGTGSAPFRAFTMRRQRTSSGPSGNAKGSMSLYFGARTPKNLPYFGPLNKIPRSFLHTQFAFSRIPGENKEYVQDKLQQDEEHIAELLNDSNTHLYICGLRGMEEGVEKTLTNIAESVGLAWLSLRDEMRDEGRYHVETY